MEALDFIGAIKVKDGIFIGDEFAAQDLEFIVTNKVQNIINCAARQVPNHWEPIGVSYLSYPWLDIDSQILFDKKNETFNEIFNFIDSAMEAGNSTLVHSVRGHSRCCTVIAAYLMKRYRWSLYKTLEFVHQRRPDLDLRTSFVHQLAGLENRLTKAGIGPRTSDWTEVTDDPTVNPEELVVRNTYMNSQIGQMVEYLEEEEVEYEPARIQWVDNGEDNKELLHDNPDHIWLNPTESGFITIKSKLKGSSLATTKIPLPTEDQYVDMTQNTDTSQFRKQIGAQSGSLPKAKSNLTTDDLSHFADTLNTAKHPGVKGSVAIRRPVRATNRLRAFSAGIKGESPQRSLKKLQPKKMDISTEVNNSLSLGHVSEALGAQKQTKSSRVGRANSGKKKLRPATAPNKRVKSLPAWRK